MAIRYSQVRSDEPALEGAVRPPGAQVGLLHQVLGLVRRAEHPIAVREQFASQRLRLTGEVRLRPLPRLLALPTLPRFRHDAGSRCCHRVPLPPILRDPRSGRPAGTGKGIASRSGSFAPVRWSSYRRRRLRLRLRPRDARHGNQARAVPAAGVHRRAGRVPGPGGGVAGADRLRPGGQRQRIRDHLGRRSPAQRHGQPGHAVRVLDDDGGAAARHPAHPGRADGDGKRLPEPGPAGEDGVDARRDLGRAAHLRHRGGLVGARLPGLRLRVPRAPPSGCAASRRQPRSSWPCGPRTRPPSTGATTRSRARSTSPRASSGRTFR